jgi:hypothetical protein
MARFGITGSLASRSSAGSRPTVESVTRRGENPKRAHRLVVVVQRLAHAHQHDVESCVCEAKLADEHPHLTRDFTGGQVAKQAHLSGQAERARHGTPDLRRDAQRHPRSVRNEHRLDVAVVRQSKEEFLGAVFRAIAMDELGSAERERRGKCRAKVARQIGHRLEARRTAAIDPVEDLAAAKPLLAVCVERVFERRALKVADVAHINWWHGIFGLRSNCRTFHDTASAQWASRPAGRACPSGEAVLECLIFPRKPFQVKGLSSLSGYQARPLRA